MLQEWGWQTFCKGPSSAYVPFGDLCSSLSSLPTAAGKPPLVGRN